MKPGDAAAQSFIPTFNVLCRLTLFLLANPIDLDKRFIYEITLRASLNGPLIASVHVDTPHLSWQRIESWEPFLRVTPGSRYFAAVEMDRQSPPLLWYWTNKEYPQGEAWVRNGTSWEEQSGRDLLFGTSGFNDVSSYPQADPSWTTTQWRNNNWKTYPQVASRLDLDSDGKVDVYTFNNSYQNGAPVMTNGTLDPTSLDPDRMAPVNLSMAFEYTSSTNSKDHKPSMKILVSRIVDYTKTASGSWPAWILLDNVRFLPLLLSPQGISLDALQLTWNSTLEQNAFRVYFANAPGHSDGRVWIYVGHFSTQTIVLQGPTWSLPVSDGFPRLAGLSLQGSILVVVSTVLAIVVTVAMTKRHRRRRGPRQPIGREP